MGKYCNEESFLSVTEKKSISHGWRGVLLGRDLLNTNMGWVVGNGLSIKAWQEPWLSVSEQKQPIGPAAEPSANILVAELFREGTRDWSIERIQTVFPEWEDTILTIKPSISGAPDKLIWLGTKSGEYTTKSGYHTAIKLRSNMEEHTQDAGEIEWFKSVWNLQTSPKVKMFLWKLFHKAIPVGEALAARHITSDVCCKRCGALESIDHLFLHCPFAQKIWASTPFATEFEYSGLIDLNDVWLDLCGKSCLPPTGVVTTQLAPWIIWQIWIARNQLIFNGKSYTEEETLTKAVTLAREWQNAQDPKLPSKQRINTTPSSTPAQCPILNTDAAWRASSNLAGFGWTLRDSTGSSSFTGYERFVGSALVAEGLALREALMRCKEKGVKKVICESDSNQLIVAVNAGGMQPELYGIVSDILELASSFDVIKFVWISRKRNCNADKLAKLSLVEVEAFMAVT